MAIDPNIKKKADDIRNKIYGKEVRESLASGLEAMSSDVVENEGRQSVVEGRQDSVESQWQVVSDEMTDKDVISAPEIIAARNGEANLKTRLDKDYQEITAQLAQTEEKSNSREINAVYPPADLVGLQDEQEQSSVMQTIVDYAKNNGYSKLYIPPIKMSFNQSVVVPSDMTIEGAGSGLVTIDMGSTNLPAFKTETPTITTMTQTTDIKQGERVHIISNSLKEGDFVRFLTKTKRFTEDWDGGTKIRDYYTNGELFEVSEAKSNSLLFTHDAHLDIPYVNAETVEAFTPNKNIVLSGFTVKHDQKESGYSIGVRIDHTKDFKLKDIKTLNTNQAGVYIGKSIGGTFEDISGVGGNASLGLNYLISINDGSKNINGRNVKGSNYRHLLAGGGTGYAIPINVIVDGIIAEMSQDHSLDTHANTMNFTYSNAVVDNGMSMSGIGHTAENIKSRTGNFLSYEGGINSVFRNITYDSLTEMYTNNAYSIFYLKMLILLLHIIFLLEIAYTEIQKESHIEISK